VNAAILASSNGPVWLLLFGPAAGGGLYYGLWSFYRNANKSHSFETETRVAAQPVTGTEHKVNEVRGTSSSSIQGNNVSNHRQRVQRVP
jgi:hypothetical protein